MVSNLKSLLSLAAVLCIFWCAACKSKPKENLKFFNEGTVVSRRYYTVDDKIEGKMTDYYPDGKVRLERFFENGVENGRTVVYYPDGKLKEAQYYVNGKQQGGDTTWFQDGRVQFVINFKDGKKDGYMRRWTPEGALFLEALYEMDSLKEAKNNLAPVKKIENQ